MGNKLYVGNLSYNIRDEDLQQAFAQYGNVSSAKVMMDRDTGRSKGFGFVETLVRNIPFSFNADSAVQAAALLSLNPALTAHATQLYLSGLQS